MAQHDRVVHLSPRIRLTRHNLLRSAIVSTATSLAACMSPLGRNLPPIATVAPSPTVTPSPTVAPSPTVVAELDTSTLIKQLAPSVVMVRATLSPSSVPNKRRASGTGVVVRINKTLFILTNAHVVAGALRITIATAGSEYERPAKRVGMSFFDDLAVLSISDTTDLVPVILGSSATLTPGEDVIALGFPFGDELSVGMSHAVGTMSQIVTIKPFKRLVQHNAEIDPGYSGGPLVNRRGEVVGINTMEVGNGLKFAVALDEVRDVIADLAHGERRQWLGLKLEAYQLSPNIHGLLVAGVEPDSPAAQAGMLVGDLLLTLQEQPVTSMDELYATLDGQRGGDELSIGLLRFTADPPLPMAGVLTLSDPHGRNMVAPLSYAIALQPTEAQLGAWRNELRQFRADSLMPLLFDTFDSHLADRSWPKTDTSLLRHNQYELRITAPNTTRASFWQPRGEDTLLGDTYVLEVRVAFATFEGTSGVGISFDGQSADTYSMFVIRRDNTCQLVTMRQGTFDPLYSSNPIATTAINGDTNRLQLVRRNSRIECAINDTPVCALRTTPFNGGRVGVAMLGAADITSPAMAIADDFVIEVPRT